MTLRIAAVLPGLGRVQRGAETAFLELAGEWAKVPGVTVDAFGTGTDVPAGVRPVLVGCVDRRRFEGWPTLPALRSEYEYEELTFAWSLWRSGKFKPARYDVTVGCTYPWVNWFLRRTRRRGRPRQVFVTQNGDWMARAANREYRFFRCDGLVCTNPEYFERHAEHYRCALIPNGTDVDRFRPPAGPDDMDNDSRFPPDKPVVLMASALIPSKRVLEGIRAAALVPDLFLAVVGDGPLRDEARRLAAELLPGRHLLLGSVPRERMPGLYRRAAAFLHMSKDEPFGIVYLEAAAAGLPQVIHDGPNTRWIMGDAAVYADTDAPGAVAAGLREALRPDGHLGRLARERVAAEWTWAKQSGRYLEFMRDVAGLEARPAVR